MLSANFLAATFNAEDGTGRYLTRTTIFFPYSNIKDTFWETRDLVRVLVLGLGHSAFGGDWRQSRSDSEGRKGWRNVAEHPGRDSLKRKDEGRYKNVSYF